LLAIAILTALCGESTGGISSTVVYCGLAFSENDQAWLDGKLTAPTASR
jgi:hypothetical protein